MKENYKNYIIYINNPIKLKKGGYCIKYQIANKEAFNLDLPNIENQEKAKATALLDAKKYIDENL